MIDRRSLLKSTAAVLALATSTQSLAASEDQLKVVATFSILGDMVSRIGGEHIELTTLVGPNGDAHVLQPSPSDARAVSEARLLFANGLAFEGWLDRLVEASSFSGVHVVATEGIEAIAYEEEEHHDDEEHDDDHKDHSGHKDGDHDDHAGHKDDRRDDHDDHADHKDDDHDDHAHHDHGAFDPHAWQSLTNAVVYADNIAAALSKTDPGNASVYFENRAAYVAEIEALDAEIRQMLAQLPKSSRTIVTSHDAFQYFGRDYGLTFLAPQGLSTESEASAKDVARLIRQIRDEDIKAVFVENVADARLLEQIAAETGARIGGKLYPGALSEPDGPAGTYLDMMRHNATTLAGALGA